MKFNAKIDNFSRLTNKTSIAQSLSQCQRWNLGEMACTTVNIMDNDSHNPIDSDYWAMPQTFYRGIRILFSMAIEPKHYMSQSLSTIWFRSSFPFK